MMDRREFLVRLAVGAATLAAGAATRAPEPCAECGQVEWGQVGEYPCPRCGRPQLWDLPPIYGDGIHDDHPGIQARLDAGLPVELGARHYVLGRTVHVPAGASFVAIGSVLWCQHLAGPGIYVHGPTDGWPANGVSLAPTGASADHLLAE